MRMADSALTTSCPFPCSTRRASDSLDSLVTVLWDFPFGSGADWRERSPQKSAVTALLGSRGSTCAGSARVGHHKWLWHSRGTTERTLCSPTERSLATVFVPPKTPAARWVCAQYVANLSGFASTCKFGALQEEMIRDQLIEHTNDAKVRETLLLEPDDLPLSRAITIALRIESAAACASALTKQQTIADCQPPPPCHNRCTTQPEWYIGGSRFLCSYATEATTKVSATPTSITALW